MKQLFFVSYLVCFTACIFAQNNKYSNYYYQRVSLFDELSINNKDIVFVGNSITDGAEWTELFNCPHVKNRGISGDIVEGVLDRMPSILKGKPKKVFLMIGINDLSRGRTPDTIAVEIEKIINVIKMKSSQTKIYIQSVLPSDKKFSDDIVKQGGIKGLNDLLRLISKEYKTTYIDLYGYFLDEDGKGINPTYSNDGLHLMGKGYYLWKQIVCQYVKK